MKGEIHGTRNHQTRIGKPQLCLRRGRKIEILFAALDSFEEARDGRVHKYRNDTQEKIDAAARDLQTTAEAARVVQKQKDLENLKNQFDTDTAAFDFMTDKIDKRLGGFGLIAVRSEMIEVIEERLDRLQKIVDEADTGEKKPTERNPRSAGEKAQAGKPNQDRAGATGYANRRKRRSAPQVQPARTQETGATKKMKR